MKTYYTIPALCGLIGTLASVQAAQIDVFNDPALTTFSTAGALGTNIKVLTGNQTWTADNQYILTDRVFIPNGVTLTIEPGTKIYGSFNDNGTPLTKSDDKVGSLIATRGGRLVAEGTAEKPIIFTSIRELEAQLGLDSPFDPDTAVGPAPSFNDGGQWGGIVLLGNSYVLDVSDAAGTNRGTQNIEGFIDGASVSNDGDTRPDATQYGPSTGFALDLADDSGSLRYVSIRHGGYEFASGSEINGLTLGGVGSGTTIEFVEVYANSDDGIEFFGGTVSTNNIVMAFNQDDSFDIDEGHKADHQFWFAVQNPGIADNGGEWDGVDGTSGGFNAGEAVGNQSKPVIYNATFVGPGANRTASLIAAGTGQVLTEKGNRAFLIEDRFNGELYNAIVHDFSEGLVKFNDNATSTGPTAAFENILIGSFGDGTGAVLPNGGAIDNDLYITGTNGYDLFFDGGTGEPIDGNTDGGTDPQFTAYTRGTNNRLLTLNPIPAPASPALSLPVTAGAPVAAGYRGAFGTENWMDCWAKFNDFTKPQIDVFNDPALTTFSTAGALGTNIKVLTGNQTWTADKTYILTDRVFIPNGVTLTIEPGTKIYGSFNDNGTPLTKSDDKVGSLIATRGGRLVAEGTAEKPIIFTSIRELEAQLGLDSPFDPDTAVGPAPSFNDGGQWGGIVLLGNSYVLDVSDAAGTNRGTQNIEGFIDGASVSNDGDTRPDATQYGPSTGFALDLADDSGSLRYVSIRHGGYEFASGSEINGLTLGGVGSGTTIEFVEVYANSDDGIEFFGGTVSTNNIVMAFNQDDSFDIDEGHKADHQFWFAVQNPGIADNGGEWDGVDGTSGGFNAGEAVGNQSKPVIYNATFVGPGANRTASLIAAGTGQVLTEKGNRAFLIEDRFNGELYNAIVHDFSEGLVKFNDNATSTGPTAAFENILIGSFGDGTGAVLPNGGAIDNDLYITGTNGYDLFFDGGTGEPIDGNTDGGTNPQFTAYTRGTNNRLIEINPVPAPGSPALTLSITPGAPSTAVYRGAFGPEGNWAAGWSNASNAFLTGAAPAASSVVVDTDGDGIDDALETSPELSALGFTVGVNDSALFASLASPTQLLNIGYFANTIDTGTGDAVLTLELEGSTDLLDWDFVQDVNVGLPNGTKFYRFTDGN